MLKRLTIAVALVAMLAPAAYGAGVVKVGDNYFVRKSGVPSVTAKAGERVRFSFVGKTLHNATVRSGPSKFRSPNKKSGTYRTPRLKKGTYRVYCTLHGVRDQSMKIVVK